MLPSNVVLLQSEPGVTQSLVASLCKSFRSVRPAPSLNDLRRDLAKSSLEIVIVDMEIVSTFEVECLSHDFPGARIICNHRLADEQMWTAALSAGAADCCPSYDTQGILRAALQNEASARRAA